MRTLAPALLRAGGGRRAIAVVVATAVATAVLLAAASLAMLWFDGVPRGYQPVGNDGFTMEAPDVNEIVAEPSTRVGVLFGALVLVLPPLMLLDQAVRLGTATRTRRDAALRIAGATRADVRRLAALEVALPSAVGALLGIPAFLLLRSVLAGGFLPSAAFPPPWLVVLVLALVALLGAGVGARAGRADPLAASRGTDARSGLGWWGPVALVAGLLLYVAAITGHGSVLADVGALAGLGLLVLGLVGCAPWVAFLVARRAERRATTVAELLAARRVLVAPGAAGRAAAGIGAVGLALGATIAFSADVVGMGYWGDFDTYDEGAVATAVAALLALAVLVGSLAVHAVESLWESRRELAFLAATGTPPEVLDRALLLQIRLVAVPLGVGGAVLGGLGYPLLVGGGAVALLVSSVGVVLIALAMGGASWAAARLVRTTARAAAAPTYLRTE